MGSLKNTQNTKLIDSATITNYLNVIFLNTNVCHNKNIALMKETDDPGGLLAYLNTQLAATEAAGDKSAWIIGNLAPGNKHCNTRWAQRYNTIIERYQKVVLFQHFGHDEKEFFQL